MRTLGKLSERPLPEENTAFLRTYRHERWVIAAAATVVMSLIGALYSWALFTQPLMAAFHGSLTTTTGVFALAQLSLAVPGVLLGRYWQDRMGPSRAAMTGIVLWGCGNLLGGLGLQAFGVPWLLLTYGLMGGIGAGMACGTSLATLSQWFPGHPGAAGGLAAGGFGVGTVLYSQWVPSLHGFQAATVHASALIARHGAAAAMDAMDAMDVFVVAEVLIVSGLIFVLIGLPAASLLLYPPPPRGSVAARSKVVIAWGLAPAQVLRTARFYLLWLQLFVNALAGMTLVSNAVLILVDITHRSPAWLASLFGAVSLCHAAGWVLWGWIAGRIGCRLTFMAMLALQAASLLWLATVHELTQALTAVSLVLLCCGGGFGVMPACNLRSFGTRHIGRNNGLLLSAPGVAGVLGPILAALLKDLTGSFAAMMPVLAGLLVLAMALPLLTRLPSPAGAAPRGSAPDTGSLASSYSGLKGLTPHRSEPAARRCR